MNEWEDLRYKMIGLWPKLLMEAGVDQKWLSKRVGPCPFCGGRDRYVFDDLQGRGTYFCRKCSARGGDGMQFLMQWANIRFADALTTVRSFLGAAPARPFPRHDRSAIASSSAVRPRRDGRELWELARPLLKGDGADWYLKGRKIDLPAYPGALRFAPIAPYYEDGQPSPDEYSALISAVTTPDGKIATVHRTYLRAGRKADVRAAKKLAGPIGENASIKLFECDGDLAVAEGIETALAVHKMTHLPVWSLISAGNMFKFEPPRQVKHLVIYGDCDRSYAGQQAAYGLAARIASKGVDVDVMIPSEPGSDWADVWVQDRRDSE
jgi:putative DNA primase/helicase